MPPDLPFYLSWVLIVSGVFSFSGGTETELAEALSYHSMITQLVTASLKACPRLGVLSYARPGSYSTPWTSTSSNAQGRFVAVLRSESRILLTASLTGGAGASWSALTCASITAPSGEVSSHEV
jgi:hypothetical protein